MNYITKIITLLVVSSTISLAAHASVESMNCEVKNVFGVTVATGEIDKSDLSFKLSAGGVPFQDLWIRKSTGQEIEMVSRPSQLWKYFFKLDTALKPGTHSYTGQLYSMYNRMIIGGIPTYAGSFNCSITVE